MKLQYTVHDKVKELREYLELVHRRFFPIEKFYQIDD